MATKVLPKRGPRPFTDRRANSLKTQRVKLPWPKDKPFKILSLDGGGIRGLFAASLLAEVEKTMLPRGARIADYFDMVAGTSTGGIIAIALGLRKPASVVRDLYLVEGEKVFPPFWIRHPKIAFVRQAFRPLHDDKLLEQLLFKTFGEDKLGDSVTRLVIPAFKGDPAEITVFKTDHHFDFKNDWRTYAWEVARATSAAPTYFAGSKGDSYVFLDGGVWANNPTMAAIVDALSAYDISRDQISVLSIGTGNPPVDLARFAACGGFLGWLTIIETAMFLTTDNAAAQACLLIGPQRIVRCEPSGAAAKIKLNDWAKAVALLPPMASSELSTRTAEFAEFFRETADARERFHTRKPPVIDAPIA